MCVCVVCCRGSGPAIAPLSMVQLWLSLGPTHRLAIEILASSWPLPLQRRSISPWPVARLTPATIRLRSRPAERPHQPSTTASRGAGTREMKAPITPARREGESEEYLAS